MNLKKFYIISMPIGNLEDISLRGLKILKQCETIIVEEYKVGKKNLDLLGIDSSQKKILVLNEHTESVLGQKNNRNNEDLKQLKKEVIETNEVAMICDGGTPLIADPGHPLINYLIRCQVSITHVSGACSIISALVLSGFPLNKFHYIGFLAQNSQKRIEQLKKIYKIKNLLVIMETPYRLQVLLTDCHKTFPAHTQIVLAFNLSQDDEFIYRGNIKQANEYYQKKEKNRQPFVLMIYNR